MPSYDMSDENKILQILDEFFKSFFNTICATKGGGTTNFPGALECITDCSGILIVQSLVVCVIICPPGLFLCPL